MRNICIFLFFILSITIKAQEYRGSAASKFVKGAEAIRFTNNKIPDFLLFKENNTISVTQFFIWLKSTYNVDANISFAELKTEPDQFGYTHIRYNQYYNNIPINNAVITLHIKNGNVLSFSSNIANTVTTATSIPGLTEDAALKSALKHINAKVYQWELPNNSNLNKSLVSLNQPKGQMCYINIGNNLFSLAFKFDIYAYEPLSRDEVFVDASNGSILFTNSLLNSVDRLGNAVTKYSGTQQITTDSISGIYRLRESGRGNGIETYNMKTGTIIANAVDFTDLNNVWDTTNVEKDEIATDVHWGAEKTYDYYKTRFNRNSIDGNGYALKSYVHYSVNFANAYWDGSEMIFGDGNTTLQPIVALDIIGHEISHGFTSFTSKLNLSNESGALNEGFSDIFGTCIEFYAKPSTANWTLGEDVGTPVRDISNPKSKSNPNTYQGTYWIASSSTPNSSNDYGGIHTNSTILGYWFYLLSQGGSGTNDLSNSYNVTGIGILKAEQIAYRMQTVYLNSNSNFSDARYYAIQSAIDIFGACSAEVESTTNAMHAIGVGAAYISGVTANFTSDFTSFCRKPIAVTFKNISTNAQSFLWSFGDGQTSTDMNPTHTYDSLGVFTVKLFADAGTCSKDSITKIDYISILTSNPCTEVMLANNSTYISSCNGVLYDMGGVNNYPDNTYGTTTIFAPGASSLTLTFDEFSYENGKDFLRIYDGNTTGNTVIGDYTGTTLPNGGTITTTSGAVTIEHTSDAAANSTGFRMHWQCNAATEKPVAAYYVSDSTTCNGNIRFYDVTTKGVSSWKWYFGDGTSSSDQNPVHSYTSTGSYTVKLVVSNSIGMDSITKTNIITYTIPMISSVIGDTRCDSGSVNLSALGTGQINWYSSLTDTISKCTGSNYVTPVIDSTTYFYVTSMHKSVLHVSPSSNTAVGAGGFYNQAKANYMLFNSYKQQKLVSVKVYAASAGDRTIILRSITGDILASKTVTIPNGESRVYLNFDLPVANGMRLEGPLNPNLYRNSVGAVYPYSIPGVLSITGNSSTTPGYYYYFYDWELQASTCESNRTKVTATVNHTPIAQFTSQMNNKLCSFTNTTKGNVSSLYWDFGDQTTSTLTNPTHTYAVVGQYNVKLAATNGNCTDTIKQTINVTDGINEIAINSLKIMPNPAHERFTIDFGTALLNEAQLEVFDILGKKMNAYTLNIAKTEINISGYERGVYLLKILINNQIFSKKLVVN